MTHFAVAQLDRPSGELDDVADALKDSCWGDLAIEAARGSDRGLLLTAAAIIEQQLKELLLSDPGPVQPAMQKLIDPGGPLCHRAALLDHLDRDGFMSDREAAAVHSLFACADRHFSSWADKATLDAEAWAALKPFLDFEIATVQATSNPDRAAFFWSFWELTRALLDRISEREQGLA